jgi:hypothetical protein
MVTPAAALGGTGDRVSFPRVARRFALLHPWLGTVAPLGLRRGQQERRCVTGTGASGSTRTSILMARGVARVGA